MVDLDSLIKEFTFPKKNVENLIALYLDGNTVPFIARYRKEQTGAMDEIQIRNILERYEYLENLNKRKDEVIKNIDEKGKLTDELKLALQKAATLTEVEDLYAPYKSKKKTKADIAREAGIEPVAEYIKTHNDLSELENFAKDYINEKAADIDTVLSMARDIITEDIGHNINIKNRLREIYNKNAVISSAAAEDFQERTPYEAYYEFEEKINAALVSLIEEKQIDLIYAHWTDDIQHDHINLSRAVIHAGRHVPRILMYRSNWYISAGNFKENFFVDISDTWEIKERAILAHQSECRRVDSQWVEYMKRDALNKGMIAGVTYAECFETIKWLM